MPLDSNDVTFGDLLTRVMTDRGLTNMQAGSEMGVDTSAISRWRSGQATPRADKRGAAARFLGMTTEALDDLLDGQDPLKSELRALRGEVASIVEMVALLVERTEPAAPPARRRGRGADAESR
jgi:transcriptional regulator with XRE-family HTH domain